MPAWSAFGAGAGQDHSGRTGIIEANEQLIVTPFPCHRHPASCHPLRDLPADRGLPARHPQRGANRALPAGPSRSARPSRPVRSAARSSIPLVPSPAATFPNPERPRTPSVAAVQRGNLVVEVATWCCAELSDLYGRTGQVEWGGRLRGAPFRVADVAGRQAPDLAGTGAGKGRPVAGVVTSAAGRSGTARRRRLSGGRPGGRRRAAAAADRSPPGYRPRLVRLPRR
jgi:hypothetical protein